MKSIFIKFVLDGFISYIFTKPLRGKRYRNRMRIHNIICTYVCMCVRACMRKH